MLMRSVAFRWGFTGGTSMSGLDRAARGVIVVLVALTLAAWGNSEADQRKAFIAFLQDMNNRPGAHVLIPSANDEKRSVRTWRTTR